MGTKYRIKSINKYQSLKPRPPHHLAFCIYVLGFFVFMFWVILYLCFGFFCIYVLGYFVFMFWVILYLCFGFFCIYVLGFFVFMFWFFLDLCFLFFFPFLLFLSGHFTLAIHLFLHINVSTDKVRFGLIKLDFPCHFL